MTTRITVEGHFLILFAVPIQVAFSSYRVDDKDVVAIAVICTVEDTAQGLLGRIGISATIKVVAIHTVQVIDGTHTDTPNMDCDSEVFFISWRSTSIIGEVHGEHERSHFHIVIYMHTFIKLQGEVEGDGVTGGGSTQDKASLVPIVRIQFGSLVILIPTCRLVIIQTRLEDQGKCIICTQIRVLCRSNPSIVIKASLGIRVPLDICASPL